MIKKVYLAIAALLMVSSLHAQLSRQTADSIVANIKTASIPDKEEYVWADADSTKDVLPRLQALVDGLSARGGGHVIIEPGTYFLAGPLVLKSGIDLHLCQGARLKFSGRASNFLPVVPTRWEGINIMGRSAMIYSNGQHDITITGNGEIDAQGGLEMAKWGMPAGTTAFEENAHGTHGETVEMPDVRRLRAMESEPRIFGEGTFLRPAAVEFYDCQRIMIEGITLRNSPFWCLHPVYCRDVTVRSITIDSHFPNNDGCDPESSCNVLIENCTFRTGDDAVAIKSGRDADGRRVGKPSQNIVIRHCRFFSECNGLCIGSEMSGGVSDIYMYDVEIGRVKNALLFKSNLDRGGYIRRVLVDSIAIAGVQGAVLRFETNYFGYRGGNFPAQYEQFRISRVNAGKAEGYGIYYDGPGEASDGTVTGKNKAFAIRDIEVSDFHVRQATHPYYLYNTQRCRFINASVGKTAIPEYPEESPQRQSCDVW